MINLLLDLAFRDKKLFEVVPGLSRTTTALFQTQMTSSRWFARLPLLDKDWGCLPKAQEMS